jgi:hypothetical protein
MVNSSCGVPIAAHRHDIAPWAVAFITFQRAFITRLRHRLPGPFCSTASFAQG